MNLFESTIDEYINEYGTLNEKDVHELYLGSYREIFVKSPKNIEEGSAFSGAGAILFSTLTFILECVGASLIEGSLMKGKEIILNKLQKDKSAIIAKAPEVSTELTKETIEKLLLLLQKQLSEMDKKEQ